MADVFLSYVSEDRATAEKISQGLQANGISVWWDRHIRGGVNFSHEIEHQLEVATTVVVLWSVRSQHSNWVRDEASYARDQNKLIPVRLDDVQVPMGFRQLQALEFARWNGDFQSGAFVDLVDSLRQVRGETASPPTAPRGIRKWRRPWLAAVAAVAVGATIAAIGWRLARDTTAGPTQSNNGRVEIIAFTPSTPGDEVARFAKSVPDEIARVFATNDLKAVLHEQANGSTDRPEFKLQGTVRRDRDDLVVDADILHQRDGQVLWSHEMRLEAADSDLLQERLAIRVGDVLACAIQYRKRVNEDPSPNLFSKFLNRCAAVRIGPAEQLPALSRRILDEAPQYAATHAMYAAANAWASNQPSPSGAPRPPSDVERLRKLAYDEARAAIEIDPNVSQAYYAMAIVNDPTRTLADKERLLLKASALDPGDRSPRLDYVDVLMTAGRIAEAQNNAERIVNDYPFEFLPRRIVADLSAWQGNIEAARRQLAEVRTIKGRPVPDVLIDWNLFWTEFSFGDPKIAKEMASKEDLRRVFVDAGAGLGCMLTCVDAKSSHRQLSEDEVNLACATSRFLPYLHAIFGHVDAAYRAYAANDPPVDYTMFEPNMHTLRADSRFMTRAAKRGLVDYWLETDHWPDFCKEETLPYDCKEAARAARANAPAKARGNPQS